MTPLGQTLFGIYSLISLTTLIFIDIKKVAKENSNGWELVILIPVLIFIINVI